MLHAIVYIVVKYKYILKNLYFYGFFFFIFGTCRLRTGWSDEEGQKWRFDTKELKAEGWSWGRSFESFLGSLGLSRLEEVEEETNRWKEERKDIRGVAVACVTLDLEVV